MKKTVLSLISLSLVFVMLLALASCGSSGIEGTYTDETGVESIKLKGGKWTATSTGITIEGTYEVDGDNLTFKMEANGKDVTVYTGTVDGNKLTLKITATGQTAVYTK